MDFSNDNYRQLSYIVIKIIISVFFEMMEHICNFLTDRLAVAVSGMSSEYERFVFNFLCNKESFKKVYSLIYSVVKSGILTYQQPEEIEP
jgi:hypothetical protein